MLGRRALRQPCAPNNASQSGEGDVADVDASTGFVFDTGAIEARADRSNPKEQKA